MDKKIKGLKFLYLNIRSLYQHHDKLFLNFGEYDLICLGETWLNQKIPDHSNSHRDFTLLRYDRLNEKRGGGLITYINIGKSAHIVPTYCVNNANLEQLCIEINVPNHRKLTVINTYRPPASNPSMAIELIHNCLQSYGNLQKREIVLMDDLDMNLLKPNIIGNKQLKELCKDFNSTQLITSPTRITQTTRTLLDVIITNMNFVKESGVLDYVISDHMPIYGIRKKERTHREYCYTEGRNMKNYMVDDFRSLIINDQRWLDYWIAGNVGEMWDIMQQIILDNLNVLLPKRCIHICTNNPG